MHIFQTAREELHRQIARHAAFVKGRVLDVGASHATARYRDLFACDEYVTLDLQPGEGVDVVGKAEAIPLPDASFDSVVCTQVLGDVYALSKAFGEFYRVLRPGGVALITESLFDPLHDEPHDYWRFTAHSLRHLAEDAGFVVEVIEGRGGYRSVMAQLRARYWIERFSLYRVWYGPLAGKLFAVRGRYALMRDHMDKSKAKKLFTHGYLLIARKQ